MEGELGLKVLEGQKHSAQELPSEGRGYLKASEPVPMDLLAFDCSKRESKLAPFRAPEIDVEH